MRAQDSDADGVPDAQDCQPTNNQLWAVPSDARNLQLSGSSTVNLMWNVPSAPGGLVPMHYDVLRSTSANGFATATCLSSGGTATSFADSTATGPLYFYLIRSIDNCGGNLGTNSSGTPIVGTNCGSCQTEYCNGVDDNCDGHADETFPNLGQACTSGQGICAGSGVYVCAPSQTATTCNGTPNPAAARDELCNGLDDDCDGAVDERTPPAGSQCFNGGAHFCLGWADPMVHVGAFWIYQYEASRTDATLNNSGSGTTRACSKAGVLPWARVTEVQAAAACAAARDSANQPMRLCTAAEWTAACNNGVTTGNIWAYATTPSTYNGSTCNGVDHPPATPWPTGSGPSCYANQAAGHVYDLSGNLSEWTSTTVTVNGNTSYKARGGAYNNLQLGTSCNFDFTTWPATECLNELGFRCCSNNAP